MKIRVYQVAFECHSPQVDRETTKNGTHDKPTTFQYYKSTHQTMGNMIGVFTINSIETLAVTKVLLL